MTSAASRTTTKILWHSNAPWAPTGYGQQTALFAPYVAEEYDLTLSSNYGLEADALVWDGIPVLPGLGGDHGSATVPGHIPATFGDNRGGLLVTLYDTPAFDPSVFAQFNTICWTPVDHAPASPGTISFFRNSGAIPLAMSRFGQQELSEFEPMYVPHGVDTDIYRPEAESVREELGVPEDAFLITVVAANKGRPSRKCFQHAFEAFRIFQREHGNAYLYCHTQASPEYADGEDILALAASLELDDNLLLPPQYRMIFAPMPAKSMARIFASSDVLLNASMGEGFGVPIIEAAACGTPAIVTDFSAMPEVAGPAGWRIPGRSYWTGQASWQAVPDTPSIVKALQGCAEQNEKKRAERRTEAREHALKYDVRKVATEYLLPALHEAEERIGSRAPVKVAAKA